MSWVMTGIMAVSAGLQIGGKLGHNKDAQTAGGLVGLLGGAYGGYSAMGGMSGGTSAIPSGMASSGGMAPGVGQAGQTGGFMSSFGQGGSGWSNVGKVGGLLQNYSRANRGTSSPQPAQPLQYPSPDPPRNPWDFRENNRVPSRSDGYRRNSRMDYQSIFDEMMKQQGFTDI